MKPVIAGGSVELGLGVPFTEVSDGQDIDFVLGTQGLYMFVVNARAHDMNVGAGDLQGVIAATATLVSTGKQISIVTGCRTREFAQMTDGGLELTSPYLLPMDPNAGNPDGATIKLHVEVGDTAGHRAAADRTVVGHLP